MTISVNLDSQDSGFLFGGYLVTLCVVKSWIAYDHIAK